MVIEMEEKQAGLMTEKASYDGMTEVFKPKP